MLSPATFPEDMGTEDMDTEVMVATDMDMDTMARQMLSQATFPEDMDTEVMVVMDMDVDTMAREKLKLNQDILEDMVVTAVDMGMEADAEPGYLRGYGGYGR